MIIKSQILFLKSIFYLAAVIENGSITKAAEKNGIKQANLSRIIKDLEKSLATPLFVRKGTGLVPTQEAMVLYREALVLQEKLKVVQSLNMTRPEKTTPVLLYKPDSLSLDFLKEVSAIKIKYTPSVQDFDVGVFYEKPVQLNNSYQIGKYDMHIGKITQHLWIACLTEKPEACALADFIISRLFV